MTAINSHCSSCYFLESGRVNTTFGLRTYAYDFSQFLALLLPKLLFQKKFSNQLD